MTKPIILVTGAAGKTGGPVVRQLLERGYVRGGLRQGERVIVSGVHRIVPDQNVQITNPREPAFTLSAATR